MFVCMGNMPESKVSWNTELKSELWDETSRGSLSDSEEAQGVSVGFGGQRHREEGGQEPQEAGNPGRS